MKRIALLLLLAGCGTPQPVPAPTPAPAAKTVVPGVPAAIATEDVPGIPTEITRRLAQYQSARAASFEDFGPGGAILIATRFAETAQLHLVPFPGGRREQLTFSEEPITTAVFIPGTEDLLYSQARGGDENAQIYKLDRKTGRSSLLTDGKSRNGMGPISRKGDRMVISSTRRNGKDTDLYLLDLKSGGTEMLLETKAAFWVATDWSPDDTRLLLMRIVSVNESHLATLDVASKARTDLPVPSGPGEAYGTPRFGDGGQVWFSSDVNSEFRVLGQHTPGAAAPHRSFGGKWDVTDLEIHGKTAAYVTNEDGASRLYLYPNTPLELPAGVISGMKFSPDGKRLGFTLSRADAPSDAYTYELEEKKLVRWTYSETGGLAPETFVTPQRVAYKSFDGRDIPAYVYKPKSGKKAPVVISIHGGPESQYQPFFSPLTQYWVNELGLAVVAPNVRGSTGYGKTYTTLDNAEKREDSVKDIGALLDWIATQPDLDASRIAVHGGSYGGYMVLASLVHFGDRIKAGVDVVGIANFITFLEKTSGYRVDLRRVEYGDERDPKMRAVFERISPANHADRIRSALLVAHGRNDPRVPFFEAEQIAAKVRAQGRAVWTVYADNEGHGFARKENRDYLSAATTLFLMKNLVE